MAEREKKRTLIEGRLMNCPRCDSANDILRYVPMQQSENFLAETSPVYKCPECKWIFSPADHVVEALGSPTAKETSYGKRR